MRGSKARRKRTRIGTRHRKPGSINIRIPVTIDTLTVAMLLIQEIIALAHVIKLPLQTEKMAVIKLLPMESEKVAVSLATEDAAAVKILPTETETVKEGEK